MRLVLASLFLAGAASSMACAQGMTAAPAPTTPAPSVAAPPAPPAAAPATPGAAPAASPMPGAPVAPAAAPGATAAPAEAAPPAPTLPTTGDAALVISTLDNVCAPAVRGQKMDDVAKANGFKLNKRDNVWAKPLGGDKSYQIILYPQGANRDVCYAELHYAMGADADIAKALNVWAFVHQPPLEPTANYTQPQDPDGLKRVRRSWEYLTQGQSIGLNFSTVRKPDDTPLNPRYDTATVQYQERKL